MVESLDSLYFFSMTTVPIIRSSTLNTGLIKTCYNMQVISLQKSISEQKHPSPSFLPSSQLVIYLFSQAAFVKLLTGLEEIMNLFTGVRSKVSGEVNDGTCDCLERRRVIKAT